MSKIIFLLSVILQIFTIKSLSQLNDKHLKLSKNAFQNCHLHLFWTKINGGDTTFQKLLKANLEKVL